MIVAKAVIPDQYWILREDDRKVGNIEADPQGFRVRIGDEVRTFRTINTMRRHVQVEFEQQPGNKKSRATGNSVYGYPTTARPYNAVYDVQHQVPLWTREPRSRSWLSAGWYLVRQGRNWSVVQCPKLIMLERYEYQGPFSSESEARARL
jgi:hypothetical protein